MSLISVTVCRELSERQFQELRDMLARMERRLETMAADLSDLKREAEETKAVVEKLVGVIQRQNGRIAEASTKIDAMQKQLAAAIENANNGIDLTAIDEVKNILNEAQAEGDAAVIAASPASPETTETTEETPAA